MWKVFLVILGEKVFSFKYEKASKGMDDENLLKS